MLRDRFVIPDELPAWLTDEDVDFYAAEFERTGFRGALNRYRNIDRDWVDLQVWSRQPITVPSLFIGGERDGPTIWGQRAIDRFPETLPGLQGSHVLAWLRALGAAGARRRGKRGCSWGGSRACDSPAEHDDKEVLSGARDLVQGPR
jgi:pimeloyl-ACP methyl ester carboxylesterase